MQNNNPATLRCSLLNTPAHSSNSRSLSDSVSFPESELLDRAEVDDCLEVLDIRFGEDAAVRSSLDMKGE
jgi:hypothetical protein